MQKKIFDAIDLQDSVLMRGLSCLVKSSMLSLHYHFFEAAIYMLYVSLDASFSLVMRTPRANGIGSPSAYDAGICIENAFGEEASGMKYFEEYYEDRIKVMHPDNRLGVYPYASIAHDDFYLLYEGLREVYQFLILEDNLDLAADQIS